MNTEQARARGFGIGPVVIIFQTVAVLLVSATALFAALLGCGLSGGCSVADLAGFLSLTLLPALVVEILPIFAVYLPRITHKGFGYLIFVTIIAELTVYILVLMNMFERALLSKLSLDSWTLVYAAALTIGLLLHGYVAVTLMAPSSSRKLMLWLSTCVAGLVLITASFAAYYAYADHPSAWPTYISYGCGYEIKYHPGLQTGVLGFGKWCDKWYVERWNSESGLEVDVFTNGRGSLHDWLSEEWWIHAAVNHTRYFSSDEATDARRKFNAGNADAWRATFDEGLPPLLAKAESETVNGHEAVRFPTVPFLDTGREFFSVFIFDEKGARVALATCMIDDADMLRLCNEMIASFKFVGEEEENEEAGAFPATEQSSHSSGEADVPLVLEELPHSLDLKVNNSDGPLTVRDNDLLLVSWVSEGMDKCFLDGSIRTMPNGDPVVFNDLPVSGTRELYVYIDPSEGYEPAINLSCNLNDFQGHRNDRIQLNRAE